MLRQSGRQTIHFFQSEWLVRQRKIRAELQRVKQGRNRQFFPIFNLIQFFPNEPQVAGLQDGGGAAQIAAHFRKRRVGRNRSDR